MEVRKCLTDSVGNIPLYSCVAERVYHSFTDLLAENNTPTQVSTRFIGAILSS